MNDERHLSPGAGIVLALIACLACIWIPLLVTLNWNWQLGAVTWVGGVTLTVWRIATIPS